MVQGEYIRIVPQNFRADKLGINVRAPMDAGSIYFGVTLFWDSALVSDPLNAPNVNYVLALPGSGAGVVRADAPSAPYTALAEQGFVVVYVHPTGAGGTGLGVSVGYGNVNNPLHYMSYIGNANRGYQILAAWYEQCLTAGGPPKSISLIGHSLGAGTWLSMLALRDCMGEATWTVGSATYSRDSLFNSIRGVYCNGMTSGGLGSNRWNGPYRVMQYVAAMLHQVDRHYVLSYGDADGYAPPDFVNTIRHSLPAGHPGYIVAVPGRGHSWWNDDPTRFMQLFLAAFNQTAPLVDGVPAVPGRGY